MFKYYYILSFIILYPISTMADQQNISSKNSTYLISKINQLSKDGHINKSILLCKEARREDPTSKKLSTLYAKLLFWNHQPFLAKEVIAPYKDHAPKLYKKIYTAWAITKLKQIKEPLKQIQFISILDTFTTKSYDIQWVKIDAYIKQKEFNLALKNAQKLSKKYPKSKELHERIASLLFWTKQYKKSLTYYTILTKKYHINYQTKIQKIKNTIALSKGISDKQKNIIEVPKKTKHMMGFGYQNSDFSDNRYLDNTKYFEITMPINTYTLYLKILHTQRYGDKDTKVEGEFYPLLPNPHWGYLSFSLADNADFFSKYSIGWHHYYNWGHWQWSMGYTFNHYKNNNINLFTGEYSYYFTDEYYIKQTFYYVPANNSYALLNQIRYRALSHLEGYLNYTISHSSEELPDSDLFTGTDSQTIELGLEYPLTISTSIGTSFSKEWLDGEHQDYTRTTSKLFLKFYW